MRFHIHKWIYFDRQEYKWFLVGTGTKSLTMHSKRICEKCGQEQLRESYNCDQFGFEKSTWDRIA